MLFGLAYFGLTGTYYFYDSYIPIAVFLGMHLLFTDPSTAPRTDLGRDHLRRALRDEHDHALRAARPGWPADVLRQAAAGAAAQPDDPAHRSRRSAAAGFAGSIRRRSAASLAPRRRNLAYVTLWAIVFAAISAAQGVGDRHRGQWIPFWRQACAAERPRACAYLAQLYSTLCDAGSAWSCNELGILQRTGRERSARRAAELPPVDELPILLRGSKGPITNRTPAFLYARACAQGWSHATARWPPLLRDKMSAGSHDSPSPSFTSCISLVGNRHGPGRRAPACSYAKRLDGWTILFLASTIATSLTGFGFPFERLLPSHIVGCDFARGPGRGDLRAIRSPDGRQLAIDLRRHRGGRAVSERVRPGRAAAS